MSLALLSGLKAPGLKCLRCYYRLVLLPLKSTKMNTTRFHFLFLLRTGSVAVAAGMHIRQGQEVPRHGILCCSYGLWGCLDECVYADTLNVT